MSDTTGGLRRKIASAADLQSVVRTMKALAASNIGQYENSVRALTEYSRSVELALGACLRDGARVTPTQQGPRAAGEIGAIVFGSDQGLVGQFNELVAAHAVHTLEEIGPRVRVWAVGERVHAQLTEAGLPPIGLFTVPGSIKGITGLVGQILMASQTMHGQPEAAELYLCHNRPSSNDSYAPVSERLLPLDEAWSARLGGVAWPTPRTPEMLGGADLNLPALIREYLFVSLFRACAESLASENASRLAAMERADKNIDELLEHFRGTFRRLRQEGIDEELFDVVAGYEALSVSARAVE